jgi:hypothetical protein
VNSELRIEKLGHFSAGRGMCAITHIRRPKNEPQAVGRPRPLLANRQSPFADPSVTGHWSLVTGTSRRSRARPVC